MLAEKERVFNILKEQWQFVRENHGSLYDRGQADSYYHRAPLAHYGGVGGDYDINGNQALYGGSGRNPEIVLNAGLWGYGPSQIAGSDYTHPDTSLNIGQVVI